MKKKLSILFLFTFFISSSLNAQIIKRIGENTKQRAGQKTEQKVDEKVDKTMDKILDGSIFKKKDKKENSTDSKSSTSGTTNNSGTSNGNNGSSSGSAGSSSNSSQIKVYSKFDFIPGEKVIAIDDFSNTSVGDFPLGWNTNSSAEIVTFNDSPVKWLSITKDGFFQPEFIKEMPENFTIEFDAYTRYRSSNILAYQFQIASAVNPRKELSEQYTNNHFQLRWLASNEEAKFYVVENREIVTKNEGLSVVDLSAVNGNTNPVKVRFSIWRQKDRLRVYVNQNKIVDIPQAFNSKMKYNVFKIGSTYMNFSKADNLDEFMVSNFRYAVGSADTRSKLITEGKLVTRGILFDTNSDKINATSYGVLKDIANVLAENPSVKVKIVGHTDSDGEIQANLTLSQKRAAAVKNMLSTEFKIEESRMVTDGKGENEPSDSNATTVGKANNRRVEFIKL